MSFFKCKSVKVINNLARLGSIHIEVKDIEKQINKQTKLKRDKIITKVRRSTNDILNKYSLNFFFLLN